MRDSPAPRIQRNAAWNVVSVLLICNITADRAFGGPSDPRITPNFKDADLGQIVEAVSAATGRNFILDPRVHAQVTMLSATAMTPAAFYEAFLSILEVHGFTAVPAGQVIKIIPDANARQHPGSDLPKHIGSNSDEFVTQVIEIKNVSAAQLVPILRPMIPQYGQLAAYPASNILIISDRASNVSRMLRIIERIDRVGDQDVEVVALLNASASESVKVVNSVYPAQGASEGGPLAKIAADERSNSVLISGDAGQRSRLRALLAHLDSPAGAGGETQIRFLHYLEADKIVPKLKEQISGIAQSSPGGSNAGTTAPVQPDKSAMIWADETNNALVITASPKIMHAVLEIVDKLDQRRPQVLVEAIIAEVNVDKSAELGVNWATYAKDGNSSVPVGGFVSPVGGTSIVDLYNAYQNPSSVTTSLLQGTTIGIGKIANHGVNFLASLRALNGDSSTKIVATPSAVTMDNQEAELKVAQEVPFVTGQYSNSTATGGSSVNPFQTIQRQEVGTILKVTPTISLEGNSVAMKLSIESSSIGQKPQGAVDLVTNKRTISTKVLIEDGGVVVLGGLIEENQVKGEQRVPYLSSIPLIGLAFKTRNASITRNNLMIFIRPTILRDQAQADATSSQTYQYMREQGRNPEHGELLPLLPNERQPALPQLPESAAGHSPVPESAGSSSPR